MNTPEATIRKATEPAGNGASQDQLIADFKVVVADAEALLRATANQGGQKLDEVRAKARESLHAINLRMTELEQAMMAKTREAAQAADTYVHDNPWKAVGVAGGLGLLVGLLLRRR